MTDRLELNWKLDGLVDEQRYYCSETPIDVNNLPVQKAIIAGGVRTYSDTAIEVGKTYYVAVSSVKGSIEKVSQVIEISTGGDEHWANVIALLHFDGNLVDGSGLNFEYSGANPIFKSGKFGQALGQTYGTKNYVSRIVDLNSNICTIEAFFKQTQTAQRSMVFNTYTIGSPTGGALLSVYSNQIIFNINAETILTVPYTPDSEFHHIALVMNAGTVMLFLDGVLKNSVSSSAIIANKRMYIDVDTYNERNTGLIIDELRITKGVARYTANFTPPAAPFTGYRKQ